jgi:sec-independent protein translocase protein TatC
MAVPLRRQTRDPDGRMPLREHLRELRNRVFKAGIALVLGAIAGWFLYDPVYEALQKPILDAAHERVGELVTLSFEGVATSFNLKLRLAFYIGLVISSPVWLYQLWAFLAPGLHRSERRYTYAFAATGFPLFLAGTLLGYWILPKAMQILLGGFTPGRGSNSLDPNEYLMFVIRMVLVFGLSFELPLILVMLNVIGVLTAKRMLGWWRVMVLGITVFAAVATPTGDPLTMSLLAIPMVVLYFVATGVSTLNDRRRHREELDAFGAVSDDEASVIDPRPSHLDDLDDIS